MQNCKNLCLRFPTRRKEGPNLYKKDGDVFCTLCEIGFHLNPKKYKKPYICPCCGSRVRTRKAKHPNEKKYINLVN